jgi:hypothetical protein
MYLIEFINEHPITLGRRHVFMVSLATRKNCTRSTLRVQFVSISGIPARVSVRSQKYQLFDATT